MSTDNISDKFEEEIDLKQESPDSLHNFHVGDNHQSTPLHDSVDPELNTDSPNKAEARQSMENEDDDGQENQSAETSITTEQYDSPIKAELNPMEEQSPLGVLPDPDTLMYMAGEDSDNSDSSSSGEHSDSVTSSTEEGSEVDDMDDDDYEPNEEEPSPTTVVDLGDIETTDDFNPAENSDHAEIKAESLDEIVPNVVHEVEVETEVELEFKEEVIPESGEPSAATPPDDAMIVRNVHKRSRSNDQFLEDEPDLPKRKQQDQRNTPPPPPSTTKTSASKTTVNFLNEDLESISGNSGENSESEDVYHDEIHNAAVINALEPKEIGCGLSKKIDLVAKPDKIYYVRRDNGYIAVCKILHSRKTNNTKSPNEYYVHYLGFNKRQDSWVARHRISDNPNDLGGPALFTEFCVITDQPGGRVSGKNRQSSPILHDYYLAARENPGCEYIYRKIRPFQKRGYGEDSKDQQSHAVEAANQEAREKEHEKRTKVRHIDKLQFGDYEIETWYYSPFPDDYAKLPVLYVCEYCLKYMKFIETYKAHKYQCKVRKPPGREIYRKGTNVIFEVSGKEQPLYCQLLCLMAKFFLEHKALFFDMDPFVFYILCEIGNKGCEVGEESCHIVGYFSKEPGSLDKNNVACILVLPQHQRKGYGKLLIALSYELSRKEGFIGGPERPLSDLGRLSYRSYWAYTLLNILKLCKVSDKISITTLSEKSGITEIDVIYTLQAMNIIKYWKDQKTVCVTPRVINELLQVPQFCKPELTIDPDCLRWIKK